MLSWKPNPTEIYWKARVPEPLDLTRLTIAEASGLLRSGALSSRLLTEQQLERIAALNPQLKAFITLTAEQALAQAGQADQELSQGKDRGPLHGIPLGLKDLFETAGILTTAGASFWRENIPQQDAYAVTRLHQAGAVILGKLNMHEIALGVTSANPHYGACRNPWDLNRSSGGSSGGSAAAVASGLCLGALGTDSGGSIRIPASLSGVVGLKPTYGRVSLRGVIPLSWSSDHAGPLGRTVQDTALLYQAIAGHDPDDPASQDVAMDDPLTELESGMRGWRIALLDDPFLEVADPEVLAAVRTAALQLQDLGAELSQVAIPELHEAARVNGLIVLCEAAAFHRQRMQEHPAGFGNDVRQRLETGAATPVEDYVQARRTQAALRRKLELFFNDFDLLCLPATPVTAPFIDGLDTVAHARLLTRFTAPFNLTGLPAIALPCGMSRTGLPIGLQLVARPWAESALLRAAQAYEHATPWHTRRPAI